MGLKQKIRKKVGGGKWLANCLGIGVAGERENHVVDGVILFGKQYLSW